MQTQKIIIKQGYQPRTVYFKQGEPAQIIFYQEDPSACLHEVKSKDLNLDLALNVGDARSVSINTDQAREINFRCGMNMFHGKIIIE